jgi:hypothetical protein
VLTEKVYAVKEEKSCHEKAKTEPGTSTKTVSM